MIFRVVGVLCWIGIVAAATLTNGNWTLTSAPFGLNWASIASDSTGQHLLAAAARNGVYVSNDYGKSWSQALANDSFVWYPLSISNNGQQMISVAVNDAAYRSTDYGGTWTKLENFNAVDITSLACSETGAICLACAYGDSIFVSTDNGDNWLRSGSTQSNYLSVATNAAGSTFIAAAEYVGIFISTNSGVTWATTSLTSSLPWLQVASDASGEILAAMPKTQAVYVTLDGGATWKISTALANLATSLDFTNMHLDRDGGQLLVVSNVGTDPVFLSQDSGATWSIFSEGVTYAWRGISADATGRYLVSVTAYGGVYTYTVPAPTTCPAGKGLVGFTCVPCGCEDYNKGDSTTCKLCPDDSVSYTPYSECTRVCHYPYLVTVENSDTCVVDETVSFACTHLDLRTPLWILLLIIVFTAVCIFLNLYTIHRQILVKLPSQSALQALKQLDGGGRSGSPSASPSTSTASKLSRSLTSQSSRAMAAAYDVSFYLRVAFRSGVPALDMMTDLLYILNSTFADTTIFVLCILCFLHPVAFMARDFWRLKDTPKAMPHFYVLPIPSAIWHLFDRVDDFFKLVTFSLLCLPFVAVNAVTWLPMLLLMFLLYSNKMFAFTMYSKTWYALWTGSILRPPPSDAATAAAAVEEVAPVVDGGSAAHDAMPAVDVEFFNEQSLFCVLLQSIPQFCLQLYNVYRLHQLTPIAILSLATSMVAALNIFYRIVYYRLLLKMDLKDVPNVLLEVNQICAVDTAATTAGAGSGGAGDEETVANPLAARVGRDGDGDGDASQTTLSISADDAVAPRRSFFDALRFTFSGQRPSQSAAAGRQSVDMSVFAVTGARGERVVLHPAATRRPNDAADSEAQTLLVADLVEAQWRQRWRDEERARCVAEVLATLASDTRHRQLVADEVARQLQRQLSPDETRGDTADAPPT